MAGTATAGSDFTIGSADSVAVSAGAVSVSIPVAIVDDREDEPAETIILTLARGDGYGLGSPRVHTLTIEDNDEPGLDIREKEAWLIRFGRTVSHQVMDAVQQRFSAAASPSPGLQVTVAGEELTTTPLEENEGVLTKLLGFETVTSPQLVTASAFSFSPQAAAPAPAEQGEAPQLAIWGSGALSSFRGTEDTLSLEGDVSTALLGADWRTQQWQAGVALFRSWGSGGYEYERENGNDADVTATLTGLFPYGRYGLTPRLGIWAVAGTVWGTLSLTPDGTEREYKPAANLRMGALGIDGLLIDGGNAGLSLSTSTDLLLLSTTSEDVDGLASSEGGVSRLRLGLEATRPVPLPNDASLLPSLEIGIRQDGGDAETGFGLEVGAGIVWHDPQHGISAELRGRSLVAHVEEEFREQGMALSFAWDPSPSNRGPSLSVSHAVGASASGGMDALLSPAVMEGFDGPSSNGYQFEAQLAYGLPAFADHLTMTPAVALALSPTSTTTSLLWSLTPYSPQQRQSQPWQVALQAQRHQYSSSPAEHSLSFSLLF